MTTPISQVYIGIDVCKAWLDVWYHPQGEAARFPNTARGIGELAETLKALRVERIAMEATGGLERACARVLQKAGYATVVANPRWVQAFGHSVGKLAKTDNLDARLLALYAAHAPCEARPVETEAQEAMKALAARRRQLVCQIASERNRLHAARHLGIVAEIKEHIVFLQAACTRIEKALLAHVQKDAALNARMLILLSIPGIGQTTALTLLVDMPELGTLEKPQIAALAGLAPLDRQSGNRARKATPQGGRATVRSALYMATLSATRYNPYLKPFYQRMIDNGKPTMVALIATMRKLLLLANALLAKGKKFEPVLIHA